MTLRVVQWTTGNVGRQSVAAVAANPGLELVGCYAWSADKVGRDVGELCGLESMGVDRHQRRRRAARAAPGLRRLQPDVAVARRDGPDPRSRRQRRLDGGVHQRPPLGKDRQRIVDACEQGGSSLFGTGINPGFAELLAIVAAGVCDRIDKITISEAADTTGYDSPETEQPAGFGRPIDDRTPEMTADGTAVFGEAVAWSPTPSASSSTSRLRGRIREDHEDLDLGSWADRRPAVSPVSRRAGKGG